MTTSKEIQKLRSRMRWGDMAETGRRLGRSKQYVYAVLQGRINNHKVILELIKVIQEREMEDRKIQNLIDNM